MQDFSSLTKAIYAYTLLLKERHFRQDFLFLIMKGAHFLVALSLLALAFSFAFAYDPSPLQDFCVAIDDVKSGVFVNGKFCKDPNLVKAEDFLFRGLNVPRDTENQVGSNVTNVNVDNLAGLNTMGVSIARIDYGPLGLNPPHIHPRATEMLMCMEGTLLVGFITSNPNNTFFSQILHPGDIFVFPFGMIHFQQNIGKEKAIAFSSLSSQNPGVITVANAVFGSDPAINLEVLARAFQLDKKIVKDLQQKFWGDNNYYPRVNLRH